MTLVLMVILYFYTKSFQKATGFLIVEKYWVFLIFFYIQCLLNILTIKIYF